MLELAKHEMEVEILASLIYGAGDKPYDSFSINDVCSHLNALTNEKLIESSNRENFVQFVGHELLPEDMQSSITSKGWSGCQIMHMFNDFAEIFADLDEEDKLNEFPSSNSLACYIRAYHPDINLQSVKNSIQERFKGKDIISLKDIEEVSPELRQAMNEFSNIYELAYTFSRSQDYIYTDYNAKQAQRSSQSIS